MKTWDQRPFEIRNLFNPAFCAVVLLRALRGFEEEDISGMPFSLALLVLPLSLHKDSRETIAKHSRTYLLKTIANNPQLLVGLAKRVNALLPYTFEALGFAMQLQCFDVTKDGRIKIGPKSIRKSMTGTDESVSIQRVARIIGKEFASISDRVTIYTSLGIRP
jgi:hypothetical protein